MSRFSARVGTIVNDFIGFVVADDTNAQFNALAEDMQLAWEKNNVPYRLQNKLMAILAPMQRDMVTK